MKTLLVIFLFELINTICFSQTDIVTYDSRNAYVEKGDYYFDKKHYKKAIVYYNMAYKKDKNYYSLLRKAEVYTSMQLYDQAAECYRIYFQSDFQASDKYKLKYALLLLKNKDIKGFEKCIVDYNEYVRGEMHDYIFGKDIRLKLYKDSTIIIVENENILNTSKSEICPTIYKDKLLFASTRRNLTGSKKNNYYNIFSASILDDGQLGRLNIYNRSLNSKQNESLIYFSDITNSLYVTHGTLTNTNLKTYVANIPVDINDKLNIKEFIIEGFIDIGHISFNSDGSTMFFVSETPGGNSGLDIYTSNLVDGEWSMPQNIGKSINSGKDEMYPFILNDSILFFTSDGHIGFGGLDLYSINLNEENSTPKNLGSKVNSEYDDFCLSFSPGGLTGYFSSNRPGGIGKEDIYRLHLLNIKVKRTAHQYKSEPTIEDSKINLYLSDGEEYNITSEDKSGFNFNFLPYEAYYMVIQHENPLATDIISNDELTEKQRTKAFLNPKPFDKSIIDLQPGMRYQFNVGKNAISNEYRKALNEMSKEYQNNNINTIDLTALARQLLLIEDEIYTIQFIRDESEPVDPKSKEITTLFSNNKTLNVDGRSFFIVLPLDVEENFYIKTDLDHFKETFNPKKTGRIRVNEDPIIEEKPIIEGGWPILINTESLNDTGEKILAKDFSIIPGTFYIFALTKSFPDTDKKLEIFVPLTKGVKYNLGSEVQDENEYNKALSHMETGEGNTQHDEELIDISVLSKELDISPDDSILFSIMPVKQLGSQTSEANKVNTLINIDGKKHFITNDQKLQVQLILEQDKKVNIQTDLEYIKKNFDSSTIALKVDNTSYTTDIKEESKNLILDPVFDVIVINFNLNKYSIRSDAKSILDNKVVQILNGNNKLYVTIKGYTDPLGDAVYNEELSRNRAQSVKDYLAANGIGENRIRMFSYGETLSLKDSVNWEDLSPEQLEKYRKVEIVIYLPK